MNSANRAKTAYDAFRGGFADPVAMKIPPWDEVPSWMRDALIVAYLQGTLDATSR